MTERLRDEAFIIEGLRVTEVARQRNLTLRLMGADAVKLHCPKFAGIHERLGRSITDIDFIGLGGETDQLLRLFEDVG